LNPGILLIGSNFIETFSMELKFIKHSLDYNKISKK